RARALGAAPERSRNEAIGPRRRSGSGVAEDPVADHLYVRRRPRSPERHLGPLDVARLEKLAQEIAGRGIARLYPLKRRLAGGGADQFTLVCCGGREVEPTVATQRIVAARQRAARRELGGYRRPPCHRHAERPVGRRRRRQSGGGAGGKRNRVAWSAGIAPLE